MGTGVASQLWSPGLFVRFEDTSTRNVAYIAPRCGAMEKCGQANQPVSTGQLNALLRLHLPPINLVVYQGLDGDAESWSWLPA